jgi:hypothetical protein
MAGYKYCYRYKKRMHRTLKATAAAARMDCVAGNLHPLEVANLQRTCHRFCGTACVLQSTRGKAVSKTTGQKKARYGSGLNLSLEENRGDRFIMLHRKKQIQFRFSMTVIGFLNGTATARYRGALLVH